MTTQTKPNQPEIGNFPAEAILSRYEPSPRAVETASENPMAITFLNQLASDGDFDSVFDFVSHWMPPQAAIWWGCLCLWDAEREGANAQFESAINVLIHWLQDPENEKTRRALMNFETTYLLPSSSPLVFLAKAGFMSRGSIAPPGLPEVFAPKHVYSVLTSGAVKLLVAKSEPAKRSSTSKQFIRLAMEVLHGANRWNPG